MRILTVILFMGVAISARSQYRVAVDINSAMDNMFTSFQFCPTIVHHSLYLKMGISRGNFGNGQIEVEEGGKAAVSPYTVVNDHKENPNIQLTIYQSKNIGTGLEFGVGKFVNLGKIHSIRFDLQLKGYYIREKVTAFYVGQITDTNAFRTHYEFRRSCLSFGPEVFHSIRVSSRFTIYYGVKVPYFIPFTSSSYQSPTKKEVTVGFQPNLALGLTYAIAKRSKNKAANG